MREDAIRQTISENIDIIVHVKTLPDKSKRVTDIVEIVKHPKNNINYLYEFDPGKIVKGQRIKGRFRIRSFPKFLKDEQYICSADIPSYWK
jgi:hypothetical protein